MDRESMDHYEKQLYTVFKTFDVDNEEALDKSAVLDLCDALQLEDRGTALVGTLFQRPVERVTFTQFRNGLLSVLGAGDTAPAAATQAGAPVAPRAAPAPPHSDDDSSGREVAPKFVFGAKKYGRRSRPPGSAAASNRIASIDQSDTETKQRMKCKRSSTIMEVSNENSSPESSNLDHDRKINFEQSLALCHSLNMGGIDRQFIRQIFEDAPSNEITVGEFFDRLNTSLTMSIASSCDSNGVASNSSDGSIKDDSWGPDSMVTADAVIDAWERAGIEHSRRLLLELGYTGISIRASDLSRTLDEELHAFNVEDRTAPDARVLLLQASLALHRLRLKSAKHMTEATRAEKTKLRADLADANRRAQTLAQEVDDNHARIEASLKGRIKQLESRHADELRALQTESAAEKERASAAITRFQEAAARSAAEETRIKADAEALRERNEELSRRASLAEERALDLETERNTLATQIKLLTETMQDSKTLNDEASLTELSSKIEELRVENKLLRDRNDELCAELEAVARVGAGGGAGDVAGAEATSWREEAGLPGSRRTSSLHVAEECDHSMVSLDQKVIGHNEVVKRLQGVLENVSQVSLNEDSGCESCNALRSIITTLQDRVQEINDSVIIADQSMRLDLSMEASVQTEIDGEIDRLKTEVIEAEKRHEDEKKKLSNIIRELESSLDQMKQEYDKCEDYWTNKLEEERDAYNEEQRISDERLAELIDKITEYEQQFAPKTNNSTLPTIDEKDCLETQFLDLEDEFNKYRKDTELKLSKKEKEVEELKSKIKDLESKVDSANTSPIGYLWSQGTIHNPVQKRDYTNPAYSQSMDESVRCSSDGEREKAAMKPIQRPFAARSSSVGAIGTEEVDGPKMINCAELEGRLRQQAQQLRSRCACAALQSRCAQLSAALHSHRQSSRSESAALRARILAAETAVARLQSRLTAADLLVKELYLENCQLAHHQTRLL